MNLAETCECKAGAAGVPSEGFLKRSPSVNIPAVVCRAGAILLLSALPGAADSVKLKAASGRLYFVVPLMESGKSVQVQYKVRDGDWKNWATFDTRYNGQAVSLQITNSKATEFRLKS